MNRRQSGPTAHIYSVKAGARPIRAWCAFALTPVVVFSAVVVLPFLVGLALSFTDWDGISRVSSFDYSFAGFTNFAGALSDPDFAKILLRTSYYVCAVVVLSNVIALGLSLLVTSGLRAQNFFRALYFTPNLLGGVILGFIWTFVFNQMLPWLGEASGLGLLETSWLADPFMAMVGLVTVTVWQLSGYLMLIYVAGLVSIPDEVLDAASVDGATGLQQLLFVKAPLMIPAFTVSVFLALRNAFLVFDVNLALTDGGPFRSTELITLNVYTEAYRFFQYETAQAKALLLYLVVAAVAMAQVAVSRRFDYE